MPTGSHEQHKTSTHGKTRHEDVSGLFQSHLPGTPGPKYVFTLGIQYRGYDILSGLQKALRSISSIC